MRRLLGLSLCLYFVFFETSAQQNTTKHLVKKGETVYKISRKYGVSVQDIFNLNPGSKEVIYAGESLTIPASNNSGSSSSKSGITYRVVRGDTKIGLSRRFGVSVLSLIQQNPHIKKMLQIGHILNIDKTYEPSVPDIRDGERLVAKGETLWGIAKEYNISLDALIAANNDRLDGVLKTGQLLRIPKIRKGFNGKGNYVVQKGDTKWGLARQFNTTIKNLEANNPQIVGMLYAGQEIAIGQNTSANNATTNTVAANTGELKEEQNKTTTLNQNDNSAVTNKSLSQYEDDTDVFIEEKEEEEEETIQKTVTDTLNTIDVSSNKDIVEEQIEKDKVEEQVEQEQIETAKVEEQVEEVKAEEVEAEVQIEQEKAEQEQVEEVKVEEEIDEANIEETPEDKNIQTNKNQPSIQPTEPEISTVELDTVSKKTAETLSKKPATDSIIPVDLNPDKISDSDKTLGKFKNYTVKSGETLYSLSNKAGMTTTNFLELNPELERGVMTGQIIKMPIDSNDRENKSDLGLFANLDYNKKAQLYFYLPFSKNDFDNRNLQTGAIASTEVYTNKELEFYEGATIAMDSARQLGIQFDFEIQNSLENNTLNIKSASVPNAILAPFLSKNELPEITTEAPTNLISYTADTLNYANEKVLQSLVSKTKRKQQLLQFIKAKNANVIVVSNKETMQDKTLIDTYIPNAKYVQIDNTGFFNETDLDEALDKNKTNYLILETDRTIVYLNTTTALMSKLPINDIQMVILDEDKIPVSGAVSSIRFKILKLIYPSLFPPTNDAKTADFENQYRSKYKKEPTKNAIIGFDLTLDIIFRLVQNNKSFEQSLGGTKSKHLMLKFDYLKNKNGHFSNEGTYILQYNTENNIIELN